MESRRDWGRVLSRARLQDLGTAKQHSVFVRSVSVKTCIRPHSSIGSFWRGVDSCENLTTLVLPRTSSKSAGMVVLVFLCTWRTDYSLYINVKIPSVNITTHLVMQYLLEEVHPSEPCLIIHHNNIVSHTAQSILSRTPWAYVRAATRLCVQMWKAWTT